LALRALLRKLFTKKIGFAVSAPATLHKKNWLCGLCSGNSSQKNLALRALLRQLFTKKFGFAGSAPATLHKKIGFAGSAPATLPTKIGLAGSAPATPQGIYISV
jgi:hypothetical protein